MDSGPWSVFFGADGKLIGVQSDDFEHDVHLVVRGDFSGEQKLEYCEWLAESLNVAKAQEEGV